MYLTAVHLFGCFVLVVFRVLAIAWDRQAGRGAATTAKFLGGSRRRVVVICMIGVRKVVPFASGRFGSMCMWDDVCVGTGTTVFCVYLMSVTRDKVDRSWANRDTAVQRPRGGRE